MKYLWLALLLSPAAACAETLYRCVGSAGAVSYQAQTCAPGMRIDRMIDYVPEQVRAIPRRGHQARLVTERQVPSVTGGKTARRGTSVANARSRPDSCRAAKIRREEALERLGLQRTYAQLSKLDGPVRAACDGF